MYVEIKENKLLSWCENPYLDYEFVDIDYSTFNQNKYKVQNNQLVDISQTPEYLAEQNKIMIQTAKVTRDTAINEITNAKLLDDLQLDAGIITEAIHASRKTARLAQLAEVNTTFYTTTGLTAPTTIIA